MALAGLVLVDGQPADAVPADDRGLLFGDHVFETMVLDQGTLPLWPLHWQRLMGACQQLGISVPCESLLLADVAKLPMEGTHIVRLTITRGSSMTGYWVPDDMVPRRIVQIRPWPDDILAQRVGGLRLDVAHLRLPTFELPWQGIKHGNRLMQVMLAREAKDRGLDELFLLREDGTLSEAISANVLVVKNDQILSPSRPEVAGVGIQWLASQGVPIDFACIDQAMLNEATEVLLVNAVSGIRPVIACGQQSWGIGAVGQQLQALWAGHLP